jgi:Flp pilus assembly protein TadD
MKVVLLVMVFASVVRAEPGQTPADIANEAGRYYANADLPRAITLLRQGVTKHPTDAQLRFMLGNALYRQGDWRDAADAYAAAARLRPTHPDTQLCLGHAYYEAGDREAAVIAWRQGVKLSPHDALPRASLALGLATTGRAEEARHQAARALRLDAALRQRLAIDVRWSPAERRQIDMLLADDHRS